MLHLTLDYEWLGAILSNQAHTSTGQTPAISTLPAIHNPATGGKNNQYGFSIK